MRKKPIGLDSVDEVVSAEFLMETAEKLARTIMSKAPISIKMAKVAINNGINCDLKIGVQFEAEAYTSTFVSADRVEGIDGICREKAGRIQKIGKNDEQ